YGLHAALLMAFIWFLKQTAFWKQRIKSTHSFRFSLAHLLAVMTVVAVLAGLTRNNMFLRGNAVENIAFVFSYAIFAAASTVVWSLSFHWVLRTAGVLFVAGIVGIVTSAIALRGQPPWLPNYRLEFVKLIVAYYLIQALVLSIWLAWGQILPLRSESTRT